MNLFIGLFILVLAGGAERASAHQVHGRPSFPLGALFHPHDPHGHHRAKNTAKLAEEFNARRPRVGVTRWDLRSANGRNSVTPLRSQGICGTCVAFSAISSLESTLLYRGALPNSATADLSEQFLHYCLGQRLCDSGWWVDSAHVAAAGGGAFDESCLPYSLTAGCGKVLCGTSKNYFMNGSLVLKAVELESWDQMKAHIANYGAITLAFNIYSDFPGFPDSKFTTFPDTYVWPGSKTQKIVGGHAVSCYGFDDDMPNNQTATSRGVLFCKNSYVVPPLACSISD